MGYGVGSIVGKASVRSDITSPASGGTIIVRKEREVDCGHDELTSGTASGKSTSPTFRVFVWRQQAIAGDASESMGWEVDVYELANVDVHQAISWAEDRVGSNGMYTPVRMSHEQQRRDGNASTSRH